MSINASNLRCLKPESCHVTSQWTMLTMHLLLQQDLSHKRWLPLHPSSTLVSVPTVCTWSHVFPSSSFFKLQSALDPTVHLKVDNVDEWAFQFRFNECKYASILSRDKTKTLYVGARDSLYPTLGNTSSPEGERSMWFIDLSGSRENPIIQIEIFQKALALKEEKIQLIDTFCIQPGNLSQLQWKETSMSISLSLQETDFSPGRI